mgnify:CR=1 FL=1
MYTTDVLKKRMTDGAYDAELSKLYPSGTVDAQKKRYCRVIGEFEEFYGESREAGLFSAPGRTEIGGNHTDHNHGRVLAASVNLDAIAVAAKSEGTVVNVKSEGYAMDTIDISDLEPHEAEFGKSKALVRGVCAEFKSRGYNIGAFDAATASDVLSGSGLSSSAAFEVLLGTILNHLFNDGKVSDVEIAQIAQAAENKFFGKPCGLLDQMTSSVGSFVEIDFAEIPAIQKHLIDRAMSAGKICITATQMLDSMIVNPRPTRAEITDVANAIYDGTGAVMLSGETAAGKYPVEALKAMAMIAETTESDTNYESLCHHVGMDSTRLTISAAVSHAACTTASDIGASAIITASKSGETARLLSRFRPDAPIIACVLDETTCRQMNVYRGVTPLLMDYAHSTDELISMSVKAAEDAGLIHSGDRVVVTAGVPVGVSGTTNMIKVHLVGDTLLTGIGINPGLNAKGEVCVCRNAEEAAKKFKAGQILVVPFTTNDILPYMRQAAGIIAEEAGANSHSAIVGLTLGKPVIIGATHATRTLKDGMKISMDCARGVVQAMSE